MKLPLPGAEHLMTSDEFLELNELSDTIVLVGGGYIASNSPTPRLRSARRQLSRSVKIDAWRNSIATSSSDSLINPTGLESMCASELR
jgi:hypothetical protein